MKKSFFWVLLFAMMLPVCVKAEDEVLPLIPYPQEVSRGSGTLSLSSLTAITFDADSCREMAEGFAQRLAETSGISLTVSKGGAVAGALSLVTDESVKAGGAYDLQITGSGIMVKANSFRGFLYALATIRQLMPVAFLGHTLDAEAQWQLPQVTIHDYPLMQHRGFMLDESRHFFGLDEVKKVLDVMAFYKMSRFHWHLTDDQGWRIEIPEYPRLTTVGSIRSRSLTNKGTSPFFYDDTEYGRGCYYTLDQLREAVAYAQKLGIDIYPEVDLPGHMVAAIAAYPEFSCDPTKVYEVRVEQGISTDVLNVANPEVIKFLKCVLGHLAEVFPNPYIHLGGDECPTTSWQGNAEIKQFLQEQGLSSVNDIQPWLVEQLGVFLKENYNKDVVVWNELLDHWKSEYKTKPIIMCWLTNADYVKKSADMGFRSIYVRTYPMYLDQMQVSNSEANAEEVYQGGYGSTVLNLLPSVYAADPLSTIPGREEYLYGTQANLWCENVKNGRQVEYQLLPRMLALSEVCWLPSSKKNFEDFRQRMQYHRPMLETMGYTFCTTNYFDKIVLTEAQKLVKEGRGYVRDSKPGKVGYTTQENVDKLDAAVTALEQDMESADKLAALKTAIATFKAAPVMLPEEGKLYRLVSASTYYKEMYAGSTAYNKKGEMYIHYTPQNEPEELWQFKVLSRNTDGTPKTYTIISYVDSTEMDMNTLNKPIFFSKKSSTAMAVDVATKRFTSTSEVPFNTDVTFVPGVVNIFRYATSTNSRRVIAAASTGAVNMKSYSGYSYLLRTGTWRIEEVEADYKSLLESLCLKAEHTIERAHPGLADEPTEAAIALLQNQLVTPVHQLLGGEESISEDQYRTYIEVWRQYEAIPRPTFLDLIREDCHYYIYNGYFKSTYAKAGEGTVAHGGVDAEDDAFRWKITKVDDSGKVLITNKKTGEHAFLTTSAENTNVQLGDTPYAWTLGMQETDEGGLGIAIKDQGGSYSWYTNPNQAAWTSVLLKPKTYGASIWIFQALGNDPTSVDEVQEMWHQDEAASTGVYDLYGRQYTELPQSPGLYIVNGKKILVQ